MDHLRIGFCNDLIFFLLRRFEDESGCDRHRHELLEKEFRGVGNEDLGDGARFAGLALKVVLGQVRDRKQPAAVADVHPVGVGNIRGIVDAA